MTIRTKWHKVAEAITKIHSDGGFYGILGASGESAITDPQLESIDEIVSVVGNQPKFWVDSELIDMMGRADVISSLEALHSAGVARLPFHSMLVEWEGVHYHHLVWLCESNTDGFPFVALPFWLHRGTGQLDLSPVVIRMRLDYQLDANEVPLVGESKVGKLCIVFDGGAVPYLPDQAIPSLKSDRSWETPITRAAGVALEASLLLLNTRGVIKEVVDTVRLNKARAKSGKVAIPKHTIIRVGHVYTRSGNKIAVGEGGKRAVRVHWRRAHTRQQHIGPHALGKVKIVFIPPCLVNYIGDDELQARIPEVEVRV